MSQHILDIAPFFGISVTSDEKTANLLEELARLVPSRRQEQAGDLRVFLHPAETTGSVIRDDVRETINQGGWHSYNIRDRLELLESPERRTYCCGIRGYPSLYPSRQVRGYLLAMIIGSVLAIQSNRLLLIHGALLVNGGSGIVLTGPSGVGKSTAALRVPKPWKALADDLVAALRTPSGYQVSPLPTWSRLDTDPDTVFSQDLCQPCPLKGVYFLEQAASDSLEKISSTEAIRRLVWNSNRIYSLYTGKIRDEDRIRIKRDVLMHTTRIMAQIPSGVLKVEKEGKFWEQIPLP